MRNSHDELIESLSAKVRLGRSARRRLDRAEALFGGEAEAAARTTRDRALRGRLLRLSGRREEAIAELAAAHAADPGDARASAWLWEARGGAGVRPRHPLILAAERAEPRAWLWKAWRAVAALPRDGRRDPRARREAARLAAEAARLSPSSALAWAVVAAAASEPRRAAAAAARACAVSPGEAWLWVLRARRQGALGDEAAASASAERALALDEWVGAYAALLEDPDETDPKALRAACDRFLARRPSHAGALAFRADLRRHPGVNDFTGGLEDLRAARAAAPDRGWVRSYLSRALLQDGDLAGALAEASAGARLSPRVGWISAWHGQLLRRAGELDEAVAVLRRAVALDPGYEFARAWLGGALRAAGRPAEALPELELAARLDADYALTHHETALALRALGRRAEALLRETRAHRLDAKYLWAVGVEDGRREAAALSAEKGPDAALWRGQSRLAAGDPEGAADDLAGAASAPGFAWTRALRAQALLDAGRPDEAAAEARAAVAADPRRGEARALAGRAECLSGRWETGLRDLEAARRGLGTSQRLLLWLAEARARAAEWPGAAAAAVEASALAPADAEAAVLRAAGLWGGGDLDAAVEALRGALSSDGARVAAFVEELAARHEGRAWPRALRATALLALDRPEDARAEADAAVAEGGGAPALLLRAEVLSRVGFVAEAIADLTAAGGRSPSPALLARRARFHLQRRFYAEAAGDLTRAIAREPRSALWRRRRAEVYRLMSRYADSLADLRAAAAGAPGDLEPRLETARVLVESGRLERARAACAPLARSADPSVAWEARFVAACADLRGGRPASARAAFERLRVRTEDPRAASRARFYSLLSYALTVPRRPEMTRSASRPRLALCGLGLFPPYTATLEVLHAVSLSDVAFNNVAGHEVRDMLAAVCRDVRPAFYQAQQDEKRWAEAMFAEIAKGRSVAFVTRGHPLVFGALAVELTRRAKAEGVPLESYGAMSSIDHLLATAGKGLGVDWHGVQAFDRRALEKARAVDSGQPLIACFHEGIQGKAAVERFQRLLGKFYPEGHDCLMYGPKYDSPPAPLKLRDLAESYPDIHSSLMLFLPPVAEAAR